MNPSTLDCRVLLGWMQPEEAVPFLLNECVTEPATAPDWAERTWKTFRSRVERLPVRPGAAPRLGVLDQQDIDAQLEFARRHPEAIDVKGFVRVDPLDLQVHQLQIVTDPALVYPDQLERAGWLRTALPERDSNTAIRWRAEQNQLVFELPHGEFVLTAPAPPDARMQIAPLPAYVSVARLEDRMLLVNGYHRTFAWLSALRLLKGPSARTQLLFPLSTTLPFSSPPDPAIRERLLGPRAPTFADFFDDELALCVRTRRNKHYEMRVQVEIRGVHEEVALPAKARAAHA
jgi:hypothetical protein